MWLFARGPDTSLRARGKQIIFHLSFAVFHFSALHEGRSFSQRRKGAKKDLRNAVALCAFASLRARSSRLALERNGKWKIANDKWKMIPSCCSASPRASLFTPL